jgi:hypothetical protein
MVMDKKSLLVRRMARGEFDLTRAAEARQLPSMGCQATRHAAGCCRRYWTSRSRSSFCEHTGILMSTRGAVVPCNLLRHGL